MASADGLGRVLNVIAAASGVAIPLTGGVSVTYVHIQGGTGTATLTMTQLDANAANSIALGIGTDDFTTAGGPGKASDYYVGPDAGGTWTAKAATSAAVFTLGGATDDTGVVTVRAEQLANDYVYAVGTASAGTLVAIIHDLTVQRRPSNLKSSLVK